MKIIGLRSDAAGESHFEDVEGTPGVGERRATGAAHQPVGALPRQPLRLHQRATGVGRRLPGFDPQHDLAAKVSSPPPVLRRLEPNLPCHQ